MEQPGSREKVGFDSGGSRIVAWHYPSRNGTCVVMAGGTGVTKEPGTDRFAARFAAAGFGVLAFDFRGFGESGGSPRQVARIGDQLEDWQAAVAFARHLPGVDPGRVALWGFSLAGGQVLRVAATTSGVAAVIAQTPLVDGPAAGRNAARFQTSGALAKLVGLSLVDSVGAVFGRRPVLVPLSGPPGTVAMLTTPDAQDGPRALDPDGRYQNWSQAVAARSSAGIGAFRAVRDAARARCPMLVVAADDDRSALTEPAVRAAERAPRAELLRIAGGHYAPFLEAHGRVVEAELDFLSRHLLEAPARSTAGAAR